jgi:hypothetical protein
VELERVFGSLSKTFSKHMEFVDFTGKFWTDSQTFVFEYWTIKWNITHWTILLTTLNIRVPPLRRGIGPGTVRSLLANGFSFHFYTKTQAFLNKHFLVPKSTENSQPTVIKWTLNLIFSKYKCYSLDSVKYDKNDCYSMSLIIFNGLQNEKPKYIE